MHDQRDGLNVRGVILFIVVFVLALQFAFGCSGSADDADERFASPSATADGGVLSAEGNAPAVDAADGGAPVPTAGLCNGEGFCWENPLAHGVWASDLWATGPNDVWLVGYPGELLHFDGAQWTKVELPTFAALTAVWGSSANDVWVGGYEYYGASRTLLFHYDGSAWTLSYTAQVDAGGTPFQHVRDLWGAGPNDVWAVGEYGGIMHFDGAAWTKQSSGTAARINRVAGSSPTNVWAIGDSYGPVAALHYDGTAWHTVHTPFQGEPDAVWANAPNDVWISIHAYATTDAGAGGDLASMLHFDGSTWKEFSRPGTAPVYAIWGTSAQNVWAASVSYTEDGTAGEVLHFDGKSWKDAPFGAMPASGVITGSSANDFWFYDESTRVLMHSDGVSVTPMMQQAVTHATLSAAWGLTGDDVWAVGSEGGAGRIIHRTAQGWSPVDAGPLAPLYAIGGSAADNVWAVGEKGTVLRFDNKAWNRVGTGVASRFYGVWTSGPDDVWVIGEDVTNGGAVRTPVVLHYDGKIWGAATPIGLATIGRIAGSARDDVWLVGYGASGRLVLHFDGNSWSPISDVPLGSHGGDAISVTSKTDVWIDSVHFDGTKWTAVPVDTHVSIASIYARAPNDVWTMNAMGEVEHFDGTSFHFVTTIGQAISLRGTGSDLFVLGVAGEILHKAL